ncbi:hypothetical protein AB0I28_09780 [Phytomonospora sp. NPDC050363]|uniref:hypothetical protein n=1 Tax=Phytomonospora sp. NPDC050363 TaxID=3155642 RepID=UPI003407D4F5
MSGGPGALPTLRAKGVVGNPNLPRELGVALGSDPDPYVRLHVSMHPGLTEAERAAVDYEVKPQDRLRRLT